MFFPIAFQLLGIPQLVIFGIGVMLSLKYYSDRPVSSRYALVGFSILFLFNIIPLLFILLFYLTPNILSSYPSKIDPNLIMAGAVAMQVTQIYAYYCLLKAIFTVNPKAQLTKEQLQMILEDSE